MNKFIPFIFLSICFFACNNRQQTTVPDRVEEYVVKYAGGFKVNKYTGYTQVTVKDPWDSTRILQKYILVNREENLPERLPEGTLVRIPLQSVAVYSSIHTAILKELAALDIIKAVCEPQYMDEAYIQQGIKNGSVVDLGLASNPDVEKLIMADPEAILTSPIQGVPYGRIEKTGIPIIEIPDYMESTPLGRAEWIRFYSLFTAQENLADSLFNVVETRYMEIKDEVSKTTSRPTVFTDLKYGNSWYIAGGESFIANLLRDAGAEYIWEDDITGATPLSFENVLDKAGEADFWLIKYNQPVDMTYPALEKEFKPYSYFKAFREKSIFECNTGKVKYYEHLPIHPEYILKDMAYIFHPELFSGYQPVYYKQMQE